MELQRGTKSKFEQVLEDEYYGFPSTEQLCVGGIEADPESPVSPDHDREVQASQSRWEEARQTTN